MDLPDGVEVVGIVDGVILSDAAVGHREILSIVKEGIKVVGGGSMGALRAAELADFIASEADRTNSLITRFLEFARPLEIHAQKADLADVLDHAVEQFQRGVSGSRVSIYKNYSPDILPFPIDAELMERVFFNLITNAAEASPPDGAVTVKTRPAGENAEISVIDRGAGIDPKDRESIFNPFFTTKPEGVGLGLAIVSQIVDQHGGTMSVESELGKGSVFRVFLPMGGSGHRS